MTEPRLQSLGQALETLSEELLEPARAALREVGGEESSFEDLRRLLQEPAAPERALLSALWLVGVLERRELSEGVERLFREDPREPVQWEAAKALVSLELGATLSTATLAQPKEPSRRRAAAHALGGLQDQASISLLLRTLANREEPTALRGQAAESLGSLGSRAAVAGLLESARDSEPEVRFWSVFSLGKLGDPVARPLLEELARTDTGVFEGWGSVAEEARSALVQLERDN